MIVALTVWVALALLLGVLIGKAIHRADVAQFPDRAESPWWAVAPPPVAIGEAGEQPATPSEPPALAA